MYAIIQIHQMNLILLMLNLVKKAKNVFQYHLLYQDIIFIYAKKEVMKNMIMKAQHARQKLIYRVLIALAIVVTMNQNVMVLAQQIKLEIILIIDA